MKIIIVRHAQTDENVKAGDAARESQVLLNAEGIKQAKKLAKHLKGHNISHAYVSPQKRAVDTAQHVLAHHPAAKMEHVEHLKEQNLGIYESLPKDEFKAARKKSSEGFAVFRPEKGESYKDVQARASAFFHSLLKKHAADDTILIVSHGGTLGVLLLDIVKKEITEENYKAHKPENTAVTMLDILPNGEVDVKVINSLEHLMTADEEV